MTDRDLKVQLLLTGNEIMSGDTVDSNSALIARRLGELAIGVHRKVTVGDDIDIEGVSAKLENGILQVSLPKAVERRPRKISIA